MNQTDKEPEGNEEVCSTTEVQYAEKLVILRRDCTGRRRRLTKSNDRVEREGCMVMVSRRYCGLVSNHYNSICMFSPDAFTRCPVVDWSIVCLRCTAIHR